jgi:hypothetical protein
MMYMSASASICLSNDFVRSLSVLTRSLASAVPALSPEANKSLEDARNWWQIARSHDFSNVLLMTKLVAVGVIFEGPELVHEFVAAIKRWMAKRAKLWWKTPAGDDHMPDWIMLIGLLGWLLVAVGVAGEFVLDAKVNTDDDNIQSINITLLQDAGASAAQARGDANDAHVLAQGAASLSANANGSAIAAVQMAKGATTEAASAKKALTKVNEDVARVEDKYAPRTLSKTDRDKLVQLLKDSPVRPDKPVEIQSFTGATDGVSYGLAIVDAINDPSTGWKAKFAAQTTGVPGLFCTSSLERDCTKRSGLWRRERSTQQSRS